MPKRRSFDLMETSKRLAGRMKRRNEKKFNQTKKPRLMTGELPSLHQSSAELSSDHRSAPFRRWCGAGAAGDGSFRRIRFPIQTHLPPPRRLALKIVNRVDEINADRGQHTKRDASVRNEIKTIDGKSRLSGTNKSIEILLIFLSLV